MKSKDCDISKRRTPSATRRSSSVSTIVGALLVAACLSGNALAGNVRVWSTAIVVGDRVQLSDLCQLSGFDPKQEASFADLTITDAPRPGGSRLIHMNLIRAALAAAGANQATLSMRGATECAVSRPSVDPAAPTAPKPRTNVLTTTTGTDSSQAAPPATLRQFVLDYFNDEMARYGGTAEVIFDRTSDAMLQWSAPTHQFHAAPLDREPIGLVRLEVDLLEKGRVSQTVSLVLQVTLMRPVVIARRSINQSATVGDADLDVITMAFNRLDKLGTREKARVIGQRAKRFIRAGSMLEPALLEAVPLVVRGQFVRLTANNGGVHITTAGKATQDGLFGEVIRVRAVNNRRVEFDAVVVGPGKVEVHTNAPPRRVASARRSRP